jgi:hypothetical protein
MSKAQALDGSEKAHVNPTHIPCWKKTVLSIVAIVAITAIVTGSLALHNTSYNLRLTAAVVCLCSGSVGLASLIGGALYFIYSTPTTTTTPEQTLTQTSGKTTEATSTAQSSPKNIHPTLSLRRLTASENKGLVTLSIDYLERLRDLSKEEALTVLRQGNEAFAFRLKTSHLIALCSTSKEGITKVETYQMLGPTTTSDKDKFNADLASLHGRGIEMRQCELTTSPPSAKTGIIVSPPPPTKHTTEEPQTGLRLRSLTQSQIIQIENQFADYAKHLVEMSEEELERFTSKINDRIAFAYRLKEDPKKIGIWSQIGSTIFKLLSTGYLTERLCKTPASHIAELETMNYKLMDLVK